MQIDTAREFILDKISRELPGYFHYHNSDHALDVYAAAGRLAAGEGINPADTVLLQTTALFHDSGLIYGLEHHEASSCRVAREYLPEFGYTQDEINCICDIIMATKLPQTPHNKLEEIICDADLDYLGRNDFFILSKRLFSELEITHGLKTEAEWDKQQVSFFKSHHYFTKTAIGLREAAKEQHLRVICEALI